MTTPNRAKRASAEERYTVDAVRSLQAVDTIKNELTGYVAKFNSRRYPNWADVGTMTEIRKHLHEIERMISEARSA